MEKFMLILRGGNNMWENFSPEEMQRITERYFAWTDGLIKGGNLTGVGELEQHGRELRQVDGVMTDGPFVETKDAIGGYYLITAADYDEAVKLARESPIFAHGGFVEVRQLHPDRER